MAYKPTRMDQIKKIIKFRQEGVSLRRISGLIGISRNTVRQYLRRIEERELSLEDLDDVDLRDEVYRPDKQKEDPQEEDYLSTRSEKQNKGYVKSTKRRGP